MIIHFIFLYLLHLRQSETEVNESAFNALNAKPKARIILTCSI